MKVLMTSRDVAKSLPKELVAEIDSFIESHYEFKCNPKYKGFWGRMKAFDARFYAEQAEELHARARYVKPDLSLKPRYTFGTDPFDDEVDPVREEARQKKVIEDFIESSFSTKLMKLIDTKGKDYVEVYKRANIDRRLFSKIRSQPEYIPSKRTVIALALALELSLDETTALLKVAGFALSRSIMSDVIIEYFITQSKYDIYEINRVLFAYRQETLN